jgi:uncharacterized membrane protein
MYHDILLLFLTARQFFLFLLLMCSINCIENFFYATWLTRSPNNLAPAVKPLVLL